VYLRRKYDIDTEYTRDEIRGHTRHSDISSQRSDPGPNFPLEDILAEIRRQSG
jgi:hypothetical protein